MSFDSKKIEYSKRHINVIEIDLDFCDLTFGTGSCVGGVRSIVTTIVTVDDFNVDDEIEGNTSGAIANITAISGSSPSYTIELRITNGINFQTSPETITNNTATGSAIKNGSAPTLITSGDGKCYNTLETCQDVTNYTANNSLKTYRFCENVSPHPTGLDAIPSLKSVNISPAKIDLKGGLGVRSNVSLSFDDAPTSDINIDPYVNDRTYNSLDRAAYWVLLRARNPNYQNNNLRILSGYLNEDNSYDTANFQTRNYLIDKLNASSGQASVTGKDPLKLASNRKAQAPAPSTGLLQANLTVGATSATLIPSGVGSEYETSGWVLINSEVITFTRVGDVLTLTRAQYNTVATTHTANDTVQQCLEYSGSTRGKLDFIVDDLLTNFSNVSSSFIPTADWASEVSTYLPGLLSTIIVKPVDINVLLKELSEAMPHYLWWDERSAKIQLTALKTPPASADVLDMNENLVKNSVRIIDKTEMRLSTIFVNFGQFDPTKKIDEITNYQQSYIRVDVNSISKYGSSQIKTINSRWISNINKAAALQLGALIGRRFSDIPREISFTLEAKDSDVWIGQSRDINHRDIIDPTTGLNIDTTFQLTSVRESKNYQYTGLEYTYGNEVDSDQGAGGGEPGVDLVIFGSDQSDVNLRDVFDLLFPAPDATTEAKFIIQNGVKLGSTSTSTAGIDTGTWPAGATVTLQIDAGGYSLGMGGAGEHGTGTPNATNGGDAINMSYALEIINNGIIGSGGAGGDRDTLTAFGTANAAGGGGAGNDVGVAGSGTSYTGSATVTILTQAESGTTENGGASGIVHWNPSEPQVLVAEDGGNLGQDATTATAGLAIKKNGFTLTQTVAGDIRGSIT